MFIVLLLCFDGFSILAKKYVVNPKKDKSENLKQFAQDGILKFPDGGQKIVSTFKFNENKLQSIVDIYQRRLTVISEQKSHGE